MNSSRRKFAAILEALSVPPSARRHAATAAAPACESLEGRQLLASGLGLQSMAMPGMSMADVASQGAGFDQSNAQGMDHFGGMPGGMSGGNLGVGSSDFGPGGFGGGPGGQFGDQGMTTSSTTDASSAGVGVQATGMSGQGNPDTLGVAGQGTDAAPTADQTQLQTDLQKLQTDSQAIHDKSQVTPAMEATVRNDIKAIKGAETTTPDSKAVATLQTDLKAAQTSGAAPTDAQIALVQADQDAIYASQGVNAALISKLDTDRAAIKTASGVTSDDEATLATDQAAVKADQTKLQADDAATAAAAMPTAPATTATSPTDASATSVTPAAATLVTPTAASAMPTAPATPAAVTPSVAPVAPAVPAAMPTTTAATATATPTTPTPMPTDASTPTTPIMMTAHGHRGGHFGHSRRR